MVGDHPEQELLWQPFGTTPVLAERGIAAHGQSVYAAGPGSIHVGEFTILGSLEWKAELTLPPNAPTAPRPSAEVLREIDGCVGCGVDSEPEKMLLCSSCEAEWHTFCLNPPLANLPKGPWRCLACSVKLDSSRLNPVRRHMHAAWEAVRECKNKKKKHCRAQPFLQLPSYIEYPDYYAMISKPISLAMVKRRAADGKYKDWNSFAEAMDLVFANARQYNHPESAVVADANKLQKVFDTFKKKVPREMVAASSKGSKRPREEELSQTTSGYAHGEKKAKHERSNKKKRASSDMDGGSPSSQPQVRSFTIDKDGPLGIKFKDGDSLVVESTNEDRVGYMAGIRVGMQLTAFQGAAVSDFASTMAQIRQTSRPWELTFRMQQSELTAETSPRDFTKPRLILSAPATSSQAGRDPGKRRDKKAKKEKKHKKEKKEKLVRKEKKTRFQDPSGSAGIAERSPQPLVLKRPVQGNDGHIAPRQTEWVTVSLPYDVEPGEPFTVATDTEQRQVLFPEGGQGGDSWKFELDKLNGKVVSQLQVQLTESEKRQRESEREDMDREEERFQMELGLLGTEEKNNKPKGRMSAFWCFCGAHRNDIQAKLPGRVTEQSKLLSKMWRELPKAEQQKHYEESERDQVRHKAESTAWKKRYDHERKTLNEKHQANIQELRDRHERQRRGEIVDVDPRSSWSLQTQFDLTSTADIDAHLDRSSLPRCSVGDALSAYTYLRSMETVYGLSAFLLEDFLCGLASGRENHLLSQIHICLLKVLKIEEVNAALADDSGDSDHLLLNWFSVNYHTWPELLRQACDYYVTMPLSALSKYLSPAAGHVPPENRDDIDQREADDRMRLRAAQELKNEARAVVNSLGEDEYWCLPPPKKIAILRVIIDILVQREDAKELTKKRLAEVESRLGVDDWTGKLSECALCGDGGEIFCCDFCSCSYHQACIRPVMKEEPPEDQQWFCQFCSVEDASATSFAPLGEAYEGARHWFVGGHIFVESCSTGQFMPYTKSETLELSKRLEKVRSAKRLCAALKDRLQHLSDAPIPGELCKALNGLSVVPVPVGDSASPELQNVSSRYLRPAAPCNYSVHWDFSPETGGVWWWHNTEAAQSQWTNPMSASEVHVPPAPAVYGIEFAPAMYTKGYTENASKFSKIHYEFPVESSPAGAAETNSASESTIQNLGKNIEYVHSSMWTQWEELHLLLLVRRDGVGDWGVKAAQLGGKRSAGEIHRHYAKMESGNTAKLASPKPEKLVLFKDRMPQMCYGETARQRQDTAPASLQHTMHQLLAVESAIPQAFLANGSWYEIRGRWIAAVHAARNGKDLAVLLEQLEAAMPPALFVNAWNDTPGLVHNRHVEQVKTLVEVPQRRKTTRKTAKELKELQRLKMEQLEAAQTAAEERRRAQLGVRRQAAAGRASHRKDVAGGSGALTKREQGQVGGRNSAWTIEEMELLLTLVEKHGMGNWEVVAAGLHGDRSVGSITQKYYKITRGNGARGNRTKRALRTKGQQRQKQKEKKEEESEQEQQVYNEWDDPTVPDSELNVLQRALRHEKELRVVGATSTGAGKESADGTSAGKMSELQIQEDLSTQFGDDVKDFLAEEAERTRKARRKNPQPADWDFELLFQGWRWDLREQKVQRHYLYRELLTQTQVLRLARRGGHRKLTEFLYNLDEPEDGDTGMPGGSSLQPGLKTKAVGPVYQKVEYDNGSTFWGKMRDDNGQEEIGAFMDDRKKKKMVQFVDGKMYFLRKEDASYPVAANAQKKAEEAPTQPTIASPRSTRAAERKQRLPTRRKVRPADTPILSARGSWRYGIRRATTVAAVQLHLNCLVSAMAWSRVATVDMCDRPLVGFSDEDFPQSLDSLPDSERGCWVELAVRGTLDALVNAVALKGDGCDKGLVDASDTCSEQVLEVGAIVDPNKEEMKQVKRLDTLLMHFDRRRTALEQKQRTTMAALKTKLSQKQQAEAAARRKAANIDAYKKAAATDAEGAAATAAAAGEYGGRIVHNKGSGSGCGRRKGQDWTEEELMQLVDLVRVYGRCVPLSS